MLYDSLRKSSITIKQTFVGISDVDHDRLLTHPTKSPLLIPCDAPIVSPLSFLQSQEDYSMFVQMNNDDVVNVQSYVEYDERYTGRGGVYGKGVRGCAGEKRLL